MTEAERHKVRAETLEEVAHDMETNPHSIFRSWSISDREYLSAEVADIIRSRASDERFRARQIERRNTIVAQHVAEQMAQI